MIFTAASPRQNAVRQLHPPSSCDGHPCPMITVSSHFAHSIAPIATQSRPTESASSPSPTTRLDPRPTLPTLSTRAPPFKSP
jgi:hypothetical protein